MSKIKLIDKTYGQDPEFAVFKNGQPVILADKIQGSKKRPFDLNKDVSVQPDGVAIEFCISPAKDVTEYGQLHAHLMETGQKYLNNLGQGFEMKAISSTHYSMSDLKRYPNCMEFGCSPSYSAYTGNPFIIPPADSTTLRSFGSHICVGFKGSLEDTHAYYKEICSIIKCCDLFLGVPSLLLDRDNQRRSLYGKAGDFRLKQLKEDLVVLEYRTLGGHFNSLDMTKWRIEQFIKALEYYENSNLKDLIECEDTIQQSIDSGDTSYVEHILNHFKINTNDIKRSIAKI